MLDYVSSAIWWFMWTPLYIQATCIVFAFSLVAIPLVSSLRFEDIMGLLSIAGILFVLMS